MATPLSAPISCPRDERPSLNFEGFQAAAKSTLRQRAGNGRGNKGKDRKTSARKKSFASRALRRVCPVPAWNNTTRKSQGSRRLRSRGQRRRTNCRRCFQRAAASTLHNQQCQLLFLFITIPRGTTQQLIYDLRQQGPHAI